MIKYQEWNETNDLFEALKIEDPTLFIFKQIEPETCRLISINRFGERNMLPVYVGQDVEKIAIVIALELRKLFTDLEEEYNNNKLNIKASDIKSKENRQATLESERYHNVSEVRETDNESYQNLYKNVKNGAELSMVYLAIKSIINFITIEIY